MLNRAGRQGENLGGAGLAKDFLMETTSQVLPNNEKRNLATTIAAKYSFTIGSSARAHQCSMMKNIRLLGLSATLLLTGQAVFANASPIQKSVAGSTQLAGTTKAAGPMVTESNGAIIYQDSVGQAHSLTSEGKFIQPALSPDGKTVAFIKMEVEGDPGMDDARTSLWVADVATGQSRRLLASMPSEDRAKSLAAMWQPQFSSDGSSIFVAADAWQTSSAIHKVNVATGSHQFITDGDEVSVLQSGRYRGHLLMMRHVYIGGKTPHAIDAAYVVSPDGKKIFMIPGSDKDEGGESVQRWLRKNTAQPKANKS